MSEASGAVTPQNPNPVENQPESVSLLVPELHPEAISQTITVLHNAIKGEDVRIGAVTEGIMELANSPRKGFVKNAVLEAHIRRIDEKFSDRHGDYLRLEGRLELRPSEGTFFSQEGISGISARIQKSTDIETSFEADHHTGGFQRLTVIKSLPNGEKVTVVTNFGFPDEETAAKSRAIDKEGKKELKVWIGPLGNPLEEFYLEGEGSRDKPAQTQVSQLTTVVEKIPVVLSLLEIVTDAINIEAPTEKAKLWVTPDMSHISVDDGYIKDADGRFIGFMMSNNYGHQQFRNLTNAQTSSNTSAT